MMADISKHGTREGTVAGPKASIVVASYIDHTLLKPEATPAQVRTLCAEAVQHNFFAVCVNTCNLTLCRDALGSSPVKKCAVICFPFGADSTGIKVVSAQGALLNGADEIDMVINIGRLVAGDHKYVRDDIAEVANLCREHRILLKVIIETAKLNREQKIVACNLACEAQADFVKTCTGFGGGQATVEDVMLMCETVSRANPQVRVKASGGIRDYGTAMAMIKAGAKRLGISASVAVVQGQA